MLFDLEDFGAAEIVSWTISSNEVVEAEERRCRPSKSGRNGYVAGAYTYTNK